MSMNGQPARWFYRCPDCLSVVACATQADWNRPYGCSLCGATRMEEMGRVHRDRLIREELRAVCDERCIGARGPKCNCHCGGENHGTGRTVLVVVAESGIPCLAVPDGNGALARAQEWRASLAPAQDRFGRLCEMKRDRYLPEEDFREWLRLRRFLREVKAARTHAGRMRMLAKEGAR